MLLNVSLHASGAQLGLDQGNVNDNGTGTTSVFFMFDAGHRLTYFDPKTSKNALIDLLDAKMLCVSRRAPIDLLDV